MIVVTVICVESQKYKIAEASTTKVQYSDCGEAEASTTKVQYSDCGVAQGNAYQSVAKQI